MAQRSGKVSAALSPLGPACSPGNRGGRGGGGARPREPLPLLWAGGMEDGGAGGHLLLDALCICRAGCISERSGASWPWLRASAVWGPWLWASLLELGAGRVGRSEGYLGWSEDT